MTGFVLFMLMSTMLLKASIEDLVEKKVSLAALLAVTVSLILFGVTQSELSLPSRAAGMIPGIVLVAGSVVSKRNFGLADGILVLSAGIAFGMAGVTEILFFAFSALLVFIMVSFLVMRWKRNDRIAFFPFFLLGVMAVVL